jgi:fibronectin-binding autotransporter adhesin
MKLRVAVKTVAMLLVLTSISGLQSWAQTAVSWTGSSSGNWNTASDWNGAVVPNNGGGKTYNVTINPGSSDQTITLNLSATVTDLTLGAASGNDVTLQSVASDSLTIASGGKLTVDSTGTLLFNTTGSNITVGSGGTLTNNGTIDLEAAGETLKVTGTTTNASGATLSIEGGSSATLTGNVNNSGSFETGFSGGNNTVNVTGSFTNASGAILELYGSGDVVNVKSLSNSGTLTLESGTTLNITGGGAGITNVVAGSMITIEGTLNVVNSGTSTNGLAGLTTVAGTLDVSNGQTTAITPSGGTLTIASGGELELSDAAASNTTLSITGNVNNSGMFTTGFDGGANTVNVSGTFTNAAGAQMILYSPTDVVNVNAFSNSGSLEIGTAPGSGATLTITGGGKGITNITAGSSIELFGNLNLKNGSTTTSALANLTSVEGTLDLENNQKTAITPTGGTLTISSAGEVEISGQLASTTTLSITGSVTNSGTFATGFAGGANTINVSGTFTNKSGAMVTIYGGSNSAGTDLVNIATLSNAGTVLLAGTASTLDITGTGTLANSGSFNLTQGILKFNSSTATLTGGGTLTLGNSGGTETGKIEVGSTDTGTLTNSSGTITGYGNLGNGTLTLVNKGTISANGNVSSGTLTVQPGSTGMTNSGTLEAANQATLVLNGTFNNAGGTIEALGESGGTVNATVQLAAGTVINGGTLTTTTAGSYSGVIENAGAVTLNGVTNSGTYADTTGTTTTLKGTITNSGSITLAASTLSLGNSVTLNGTGAVVLSNSTSNVITAATTGLTLTNANTIEGAGTIEEMGIVNTGTIAADQSAVLNILPSSAGLNNSGTLSVSTGDTMKIGTSAGGALLNFSGTTLAGGTYAVSGTLEFGASGTSVVNDAANITLTGSGAKIVDFAGQNVLTDLATVTSAGSFTIGSGANFTTAGNFSNTGKLSVNAGSTFKVTGALTNFNSTTDTLTGGSYTVGGKLDFAGANIVTDAASITLSGTGEIVNSTSGGNGLANLATIASDGSLTLASKATFTTVGNLTNDGKLIVDAGTTLDVTGDLTNFHSSTDTLASGIYTVGGTLEFTGANIVNNAANLTISGSSAKILNGTANGLANFTNNTGSLAVTGDGSFTTGSANFTNSGNVAATRGSTLTVGGGEAYNQSAGTTTIDGTLTASAGINVTGGTIEGAGTLNGNVSVGGAGTAPTLNIGDSGKAGLLVITGTYTQLSTASMNAFVGGTTVGTQYSQLQLSGTATLAGTLTVALASGFTPTVGSSFTLLTAASISGTFSNSTIAINSTEHFNVTYTSTGVVLTVASGAASQSGGAPQSTPVASVPRRQPVLSSEPRHWIAAAPSGNNFLEVMGGARPQSGVVVAGSELRRYEDLNGTAELATWEHKLPVAPVTRPQFGLEHNRQTTPHANDWTEPMRGASSLRMPTNGALMQRMPVKILQPMLPRLQR